MQRQVRQREEPLLRAVCLRGRPTEREHLLQREMRLDAKTVNLSRVICCTELISIQFSTLNGIAFSAVSRRSLRHRKNALEHCLWPTGPKHVNNRLHEAACHSFCRQWVTSSVPSRVIVGSNPSVRSHALPLLLTSGTKLPSRSKLHVATETRSSSSKTHLGVLSRHAYSPSSSQSMNRLNRSQCTVRSIFLLE